MDHWTMDHGTDAQQDVVFRPGEESTSMWGSSKLWGLANGTAVKGGDSLGCVCRMGFL